MKNSIALIALTIISASAHAGGHIGQCVFHKTKIAKNGYLEFKKPILVLPSPKAKEGEPLKVLSAFKVTGEDGSFIQIADKVTNKPIGWSKLSEFEFQDLRNCNM